MHYESGFWHTSPACVKETVTVTGNGVQYNKGAVWSAFNPFYTNTQYYVSLPNGDCATAADCSSITIVNPLGSDESWSNFTIFIRFRWDGKFTPNNATDIEIFNTGWNGGGQCCLQTLAENPDADGTYFRRLSANAE